MVVVLIHGLNRYLMVTFFSGSKFSVFWRGFVDSDGFLRGCEFGSEIQKNDFRGNVGVRSLRSPSVHRIIQRAKPDF